MSSVFPKHPRTLFLASLRPQAHRTWMRQPARYASPIVCTPIPASGFPFLFRQIVGIKGDNYHSQSEP
jgi:hypothetical protein